MSKTITSKTMKPLTLPLS